LVHDIGQHVTISLEHFQIFIKIKIYGFTIAFVM